jgi:hypothetical protein
MVIVCGHCHKPTEYTGWNPLRQFVVCATLSCGRTNYVAEAAKRMHGPAAGERVSQLLHAVARMGDQGKENNANLVEAALRKLEELMAAPEEVTA